MPYQVKLTETAAELSQDFHPELKKLIKSSLKEIAENPYLGKELQEELEEYLSYRIKRYRIVYTFDERSKIVIVHLIWHRRNVYELFTELIKHS